MNPEIDHLRMQLDRLKAEVEVLRTQIATTPIATDYQASAVDAHQRVYGGTGDGTSGVDGKDGEDGKDGADGADGATYIPSLRVSADTATAGHIFLDFTNSQTGEVIEGTLNLKGADGKDGEDGTSSSGSGGTGNEVEITYVKAITYANNKCTFTLGTLKVYAADTAVTEGTAQTLFTTTEHSSQHKSASVGY